MANKGVISSSFMNIINVLHTFQNNFSISWAFFSVYMFSSSIHNNNVCLYRNILIKCVSGNKEGGQLFKVIPNMNKCLDSLLTKMVIQRTFQINLILSKTTLFKLKYMSLF